MSPPKPLKPVVSQPGRPLYKTVQDYMVGAINRGQFKPGQRLPSTKELSRQLSVSLVTTHRALQEMVGNGLLERTQGRGTFVIDDGGSRGRRLCLGLFLHPEASLADLYHGHVLQGMTGAADEHGIDLLITRIDHYRPNTCHGLLLIQPAPDDVERFIVLVKGRVPMLVVGSSPSVTGVVTIDVNPLELARLAVDHLHQLGHRRIAYLGGGRDRVSSRNLRRGFDRVCELLSIPDGSVQIIEAVGWQLDAGEQMSVSRMLAASNRPTAILAGGMFLTVDIYHIASTLGLRIPQDLSVVGTNDPASAAVMSPPLTTVRQPLTQMGHAAVSALAEHVRDAREPLRDQLLSPELHVRRSTTAPPSMIAG